MDFYQKTGKMALGSRLRRLSEQITDEAAQIYKLYSIQFQPRWFPVFYVLSHGESKTITQIAQEIGHSHVSVSQRGGKTVLWGAAQQHLGCWQLNWQE